MRKLTTNTKLLLLAVVTSALFALLGATGIYSMRSMAGEVLSDLAAAQQENKILVAIEGAHVNFKVQVQEWKNVLLRGKDPALLTRYWASFEKQETTIRAEAQKLLTLLPPGDERDHVAKFVQARIFGQFHQRYWRVSPKVQYQFSSPTGANPPGLGRFGAGFFRP